MVHFSDEGIVVFLRKHGEHAAIVECLTEQHGRVAGLAKSAYSKHNRGLFMPGNQLRLEWSARLEEHLGVWKAELMTAYAAELMVDRGALGAMQYVNNLLRITLPEREAHPRLYAELQMLYDQLRSGVQDIRAQLILLEARLLKELGYGLDVSQCAATGTTEKLIYLSPKTGRAVSAEAGRPYHSKLLPLPEWFRYALIDGDLLSEKVEEGALADAAHITGYFITHYLLEPVGKTLPEGREGVIAAKVPEMVD